ncbi:hypothetical protein V6N11_070368 [Hibiscus sabdariffa]|uniref:Uncharacterized protein n=1 Tax=Hibiscus sabdariffa TaxID=183260 RepID=A0ABR2QEX0_9ROSI
MYKDSDGRSSDGISIVPMLERSSASSTPLKEQRVVKKVHNSDGEDGISEMVYMEDEDVAMGHDSEYIAKSSSPTREVDSLNATEKNIADNVAAALKDNGGKGMHSGFIEQEVGPWMVVDNRRKRMSLNERNDNGLNEKGDQMKGSHYAALASKNINEQGLNDRGTGSGQVS